jgi:hypothetical protein
MTLASMESTLEARTEKNSDELFNPIFFSEKDETVSKIK